MGTETDIESKNGMTNTTTNPNSSNNKIKQQQIENYRQGKGLMLNVHMTHHGGTTFCGAIGNHGINGGISPSFACMGDSDKVVPPLESDKVQNRKVFPWLHNETHNAIQVIRPYFHMISWEFGKPKARPIEHTNWEDPDLLSVVITRDPISRLLAGDGDTTKRYPGYNNGTLSHEGWWEFATEKNNHNTDNFFLRLFGGHYKQNEEQKKENKDTNKNNNTRLLGKDKNKNKNKNKAKDNQVNATSSSTIAATTITTTTSDR